MPNGKSTEGTVQKKEQSFPFDIGKNGVVVLIAFLLLAAALFVVFSGESADTANPGVDETLNPDPAGAGPGVNTSEEAETTAEKNSPNIESTTVMEKEIKIYNQEFYMTDISSTESVVEFYIENRGNSPGSNWFRMQILYSFETPDGELRQSTTYIPINQERVDIAPGTKTKFTVDIKDVLGPTMGNMDVKDFEITLFESA